MSDHRKKARKRPTAAQKRREARTALLQRWDQLADDVWHLVQDIREAPAGTFTQEEYEDAVFELDNTAWNVFVNYRPRLPASEPRKVSGVTRRLGEFRRQLLHDLPDDKLADLIRNSEPATLRAFLRGEEMPPARTRDGKAGA